MYLLSTALRSPKLLISIAVVPYAPGAPLALLVGLAIGLVLGRIIRRRGGVARRLLDRRRRRRVVGPCLGIGRAAILHPEEPIAASLGDHPRVIDLDLVAGGEQHAAPSNTVERGFPLPIVVGAQPSERRHLRNRLD